MKRKGRFPTVHWPTKRFCISLVQRDRSSYLRFVDRFQWAFLLRSGPFLQLSGSLPTLFRHSTHAADRYVLLIVVLLTQHAGCVANLSHTVSAQASPDFTRSFVLLPIVVRVVMRTFRHVAYAKDGLIVVVVVDVGRDYHLQAMSNTQSSERYDRCLWGNK